VPALEVNLLSIGSLTKAKFAFNFQGDVCTIQTPGGKVLQIPRDTDNLYRLSNIEEITVDNAAVTDAENILKHIPIKNTMAYHITIVENAKVLGFEKLKLLHHTLGHRGTYSSLAKAIKTGLLDVGKAFRFNVNKIPHEKCDTCAQVKARKYAMRRQIHSSQLRPGSLISFDILGPYSVPGLSSTGTETLRYVITFCDFKSKYTHSYCMAKRDEALQKIEEFITHWKAQIGLPIRHMHTDGGKELISHGVEKVLSNEFIKLTHTSAGTPQLNGLAERRQHTVYLSAVAMLHSSRLPEKLRPYVIQWASTIDKVTPTNISTVDVETDIDTTISITPYEAAIGSVLPTLS
jgi:hypothetical protein